MKKSAKNTEIVMEVVNVKVVNVELSKIQAGSNPRTKFEEKSLNELAESIKVLGVIQPITLRPIAEEKYVIVCGERRFRASLIAGMTDIPAVIRKLTEEEAEEIAITENLQREDITPLEEAEAFQKMLDNRGYDAKQLADRYGKSETYVRSRLALNDLIPEVKELLGNEQLNISQAQVLSNYCKEVQEAIFGEHLAKDDFSSWKKLKASDLQAYISRAYESSIDTYKFDKTECDICSYNTKQSVLFCEGGGNCTNRNCLAAKNTAYLVEEAEQLMKDYPLLPCFVDNTSDVHAKELLQMKGYEFINGSLRFEPDMPQKPDMENCDSDEEYNEETEQFDADMETYEKDLAEFNKSVDNGEYKHCIYIGRLKVSLELCKEIQRTEEEPKTESPLDKIEKKDKRNRELMQEKIIADVKKMVQTRNFEKEFSAAEEDILYFFLLGYMDEKRLADFGCKGYCLPDNQRVEMIENGLTEELKTMLYRDFMVKHLCGNAYRGNVQADYLINFAKLHLPKEVEKVERQYEKEYQAKHEKLEEKKAILETQERLAKAKEAREKAEQEKKEVAA